MAENIVAGLFGLTPEMYGQQQRVGAMNEGIALAQLSPAARLCCTKAISLCA